MDEIFSHVPQLSQGQGLGNYLVLPLPLFLELIPLLRRGILFLVLILELTPTDVAPSKFWH